MSDSQEHRNWLDRAAEGVAWHGIAPPRGQARLLESRGGRFGRMFPDLPRHDPGADAIEDLAEWLISRELSGLNPEIPAGYTYLGQFLDHDITFDPTSKLQRDNDPDALVNFRTPRFDLDSVYGSGPKDQPFLYDWRSRSHPGVRLLVGHNRRDYGYVAIDLPRNQQGRALVGDARNDENLVVSQLHLLFIHFHNKVVDHVLKKSPLSSADLFDEAQRLVRWHYQWIIVNEFLPKVVGHKSLVERRLYYSWADEPFMPVEFSAAAFRFGHSMVREDYQLNEAAEGVPLFRRRGRRDHLGGLRRLPAGLAIDWDFFFENPRGPTRAQPSMLIDTRLVPALSRLPDGLALARLNLQRGRVLGLPSGADVARAMSEEPLSEKELGFDDTSPSEIMSSAARDALVRATPLWFYVLREAEIRDCSDCQGKGEHLGPVGGRIVAEVLTGLLEADPNSYLRQWPTWKPELPGTDDSFTMADLVRFTEDSG